MKRIWMITKWYPNRDDRQIGVFVQKHARSIALHYKLALLFIHSTHSVQENFEIENRVNENIDEVIIYFKKDTSIFRGIINPFRYIKSLRKGLDILNSEFPDPVAIHAYILLRTGLIAWWISKSKKIPFVISEQWSGYVTGVYENAGWLKKTLTRFVVRRASALTCVSNFLLEGMKKNGLQNKNILIIPNCIEKIVESKKRTDQTKISVLLVADLVDRIKNISGVINMISGIDRRDFELRIIGHGEDERKLKELASEKKLLDKIIFFEGLKVNKEVYEYLQRCDFLVMNSRFETFSLICAEAMSCGKPVLATRCGGPNDFVTPETGILIEPDQPEILREKFIEMLNHFSRYDEIRIKNHVESKFSFQTISNSFSNVFESLLNRDK